MSVEYPPEINSDGPREPGPEEIRVLHRADVYKRAALIAIGVLVLYLAIVGTAGVVLIRNQQVRNVGTLQSANNAARDARTTADAIHSCVTPGLRCFERAQRQTAGAVASINRVVILAAACAVGKTGTEAEIEAQIQACVIDGLARQHATP